MPTWWPFRRSTEPAASAPPRPSPGWHAVTPMQRAVGELDTTATLDGFAESLTTSADPSLTRPLDLLSANQDIAVLPFARPAAPQPSPAPAPAHRNRRWGPNLATMQRARVGSAPTVQRTADSELPPSGSELSTFELFPVYAGQESEEPVPAPEVLVHASPAEEPRVLSVAGPPTAAVSQPVQRTVTHHPVEPASPRLWSVSARGASDTTGSQPSRRLSAVQRMSVVAPVSADTEASARPLDSLPTVVVPASPPVAALMEESATATATAPTTATAAPQTPGTAAPSASATAAGAMGPHTAPGPISRVAQRVPSPAVSAAMAPLSSDDVRSPRTSSPVQRLPLVDDSPGAAAPVSRAAADTVDTVETSPSTVIATSRTATVAQPISAGPIAVQKIADAEQTTMAAVAQSVPRSNPRPIPIPEPTVVQRVSPQRRLVVLPPDRAEPDSAPTPEAGSGGRGRSVLFEGPRELGLQRMFESVQVGHDEPVPVPTTISAAAPRRTAAARQTAAPSQAADPRQAAAPRGRTFPTVTMPPQHRFDASTNTITFSSSLQRDIDTSEDLAPVHAPEPSVTEPSVTEPSVTEPSVTEPTVTATPPSVATAASAAPADRSQGADVDELLNRLYDPLAARLRAELWLDRERAGTLMDLGR